MEEVIQLKNILPSEFEEILESFSEQLNNLSVTRYIQDIEGNSIADFDEYVDDKHPIINIMGLSYLASEVLRATGDYEGSYNDWASEGCTELEDLVRIDFSKESVYLELCDCDRDEYSKFIKHVLDVDNNYLKNHTVKSDSYLEDTLEFVEETDLLACVKTIKCEINSMFEEIKNLQVTLNVLTQQSIERSVTERLI